MKTKINYLCGLMIIVFIITGTNAAMASQIIVSGIGKISGNIRNNKSDLPLENATVTLFSTTDSTMVAGTLSDTYGNFYFSMLGTGKYYIKFSIDGFKSQRLDQINISLANPKVDLGEIKLNPTPAAHKKRRSK